MKISRDKHLAYVSRLMPFLLGAYVLQTIIYLNFAPRAIVVDVMIFQAIAIVLTALCFVLYDHFHIVKLHRNHLVVGFDLANYKEEILYRNISAFKVEVTKYSYYNVTLDLRDGSTIKLYYLDDVEDLKQMIRMAS